MQKETKNHCFLVTSPNIVRMNKITKTLNKSGFETYCAFNSTDCLKMIETHNNKLQAIIIDVGMQGFDEHCIIDYISSRINKFIPFIGLANYEKEAEFLEQASDNFTIILERDTFSEQDLLDAIKSITESKNNFISLNKEQRMNLADELKGITTMPLKKLKGFSLAEHKPFNEALEDFHQSFTKKTSNNNDNITNPE